MISEFDRLEASVPGLHVASYGGVAPVQAEGTLHGLEFYFRQRSGPATLDVGGIGGRSPGSGSSLYSAVQVSDDDQSVDADWFTHIMRSLVPRLTRTGCLWRFEGAEVINDGALARTGRLLEYSTVADTVEEALAAIKDPVEGAALRRGMQSPPNPPPPGTDKDEYWALVDLCPAPLEPDARVYPDPEPVFEILPLGPQ